MSDYKGLGGCLELVTPSDLSVEQKTAYDYMVETMVPWANASGSIAQVEDGHPVSPFMTLVRSPEMARACVDFEQQEGRLTFLSKRVRLVVILAFGQEWSYDYERYAHAAVAGQAGLSEETIYALRSGTDAPELSEAEQTARELARCVTTDQIVSEHTVLVRLCLDDETRSTGRKA